MSLPEKTTETELNKVFFIRKKLGNYNGIPYSQKKVLMDDFLKVHFE